MTGPSRCGCWPTAATSSAPPARCTVNRLHRLLLELVPGGAKKSLTARQARALLADRAPR